MMLFPVRKAASPVASGAASPAAFNNKAEKFIFGAEMDIYETGRELRSLGAENKEPKAVWLLRQSSTYPKQIVVSYWRRSSANHQATFANQRYGLTSEGWQLAPQQPSNVASVQQKKAFQASMRDFDDALVLIVPPGDNDNQMSALSEAVDDLLSLFEKRGFDKNNLIKPDPNASYGFKITRPLEEQSTDYVSPSCLL